MGKNLYQYQDGNNDSSYINYLDLFEKYLSKVKKSSGSNYTALCPFHADTNPSFSFNIDTGVWQCFACGEKGNAWQFADRMHDEEWKRKIQLARKKEQGKIVENWKKDAIEKAPKIEEKASREKRIAKETTYLYHDKQGNIAYEKIRYDFADGSKTFKIDWKTEEKKHLLYDLACLSLVEPGDVSEVWFCEGEKCRDALLEATESRSDVLVFAYTISPEQEMKNSQIESYILGKRVVVFTDNDETGERKAKQVIDYTKKYARQIDVIKFTDKEKGYDIADFLEEHTVEEALLFATTEYVSKSIVISNVNEYATKQIEPVPILDELYQIPRSILSVVAGMGSVGKGYFLMWNMLRWVEKYSVAYLSAEDPIHILEHRLQKLVRKRRRRVANNKEYQVAIPQNKPLVFDPLENLTSPNLENLYDAIFFYVEQGYEIIIVDPISAFLENELNNSEVAKFMYQLQKLCVGRNVNIFLSHHVRKRQKGEQIKDKYDMMDLIRGASALHSNARYVWFLKRNALKPTAIEVWNVKNSYLPNTRDVLIDMFGDMKMSRIWLTDKGQMYTKDMVDFFIFENQKFSDDGTIPADAVKMEKTSVKKKEEEEDSDDLEGLFL